MLYDIDYSIEGIKKNKSGTYYVSNPVLYEEIIKSKEQNKLTYDAINMIMLICENISKKMYYKDPEIRKDCISNAVLDCLQYWNGFNKDKSKNPFAYFTSIAINGMTKAWYAAGKKNFPDSIMTSLDNGVYSI